MRINTLALAVLLLAGCGSTSPTPSPTSATPPSPDRLSGQWAPRVTELAGRNADCTPRTVQSDACTDYLSDVVLTWNDLGAAILELPDPSRYPQTASELDNAFDAYKELSVYCSVRPAPDLAKCHDLAAVVAGSVTAVGGALLADEK